MPDQRDRDDQRDESARVVVDQRHELVPIPGVEQAFEMAEDVMQHVDVPPRRRDRVQRFHELRRIAFAQLGARQALCVRDETPECDVVLRRVRHHLELVRGVETHQLADVEAAGEQRAQPPVREDALDPALAQPRIVEASLFFDRQRRRPVEQRLREDPAAVLLRHALLVAHRDALEAAARRALLQHVAAQIQPLELVHAAACEALHPLRVIGAAARGDEAQRTGVALEADGLARHAESDLQLRTYGHPLDEGR